MALDYHYLKDPSRALGNDSDLYRTYDGGHQKYLLTQEFESCEHLVGKAIRLSFD
jgi:hypothetical protein